MKTKGTTLTIVFGQEEVMAFNMGEKLTKCQKETHLFQYKFNSNSEAQCFINGIDEAMGWYAYQVAKIERNQIRLPLNEIPSSIIKLLQTRIYAESNIDLKKIETVLKKSRTKKKISEKLSDIFIQIDALEKILSEL